jgi:P-type conjugative transfer protein TrbJ
MCRGIGVMILLAASVAGAKAQCYGCALEVTQRQNLNRLTSTVDQLVRIMQNMEQNSRTASRDTSIAATVDLSWFERALAFGQSISAQAANADQQFRANFPGYARTVGSYTADYQKWSAIALDTSAAMIKAMAAQKAKMPGELNSAKDDIDESDTSDSHQSVMQINNRMGLKTLSELQKLRSLLIATATSRAAYEAQRVQQEAAAQAATDHFFTAVTDTTSHERIPFR